MYLYVRYGIPSRPTYNWSITTNNLSNLVIFSTLPCSSINTGQYRIQDLDKVMYSLQKQYGKIAKVGGLIGHPDLLFVFDGDEIRNIFKKEETLPHRWVTKAQSITTTPVYLGNCLPHFLFLSPFIFPPMVLINKTNEQTIYAIITSLQIETAKGFLRWWCWFNWSVSTVTIQLYSIFISTKQQYGLIESSFFFSWTCFSFHRHGEKWDNFRAQVQHVMLQPSTARKYIMPLNEIANDFMDRYLRLPLFFMILHSTRKNRILALDPRAHNHYVNLNISPEIYTLTRHIHSYVWFYIVSALFFSIFCLHSIRSTNKWH